MMYSISSNKTTSTKTDNVILTIVREELKTMAFNRTLQRFTTCCSYLKMFPILLVIVLSVISTSTLAAPQPPPPNSPNFPTGNYITSSNNPMMNQFNSHATARQMLHQGSPAAYYSTNLHKNNNNNNNIMNNKLPAQLLSPISTQSSIAPTTTTAVQQQQQHLQLQPQTQLQLNQFQQLNSYSKAANEILLDLRQQMITRSMKFDEHFRLLLSNSKLSLHNLFADTYGIMYETNTEIFTSMFEGLEQYYANGNIKLTKSMENFFVRLYQKIFQVYNSGKAFPAPYLDCLTEQLAHLKPFKDVPDKITEGIRHAFVAARTFNQALNNGITIIKNIISLGQTTQCTILINEKLLKNTIINQQTNAVKLPCTEFCESVIQRCIGTEKLAQLNEKWRGYVMALNDLAMKLSNRYNLETIIAPLDIQISEAIMNFQENAQNISQHVFQACGGDNNQQHISPFRAPPPPLPKRIGKRAAIPSSIETPMNVRNRHDQNAFGRQLSSLPLRSQIRTTERNGLSEGTVSLLDLTPITSKSPPIIDEIKNYMLSTKSFWANLPNAVCTSNYTLPFNSSISARKPPKCYSEQLASTDINSDVRYRNEISQQLTYLENVRKSIESALRGEETELPDSAVDQRLPTVISPPNPGSSIGRFSPTTTTTTTTTTTREPEADGTEEDPDQDDDEMNSPENGSGDDSVEPGDYSTPETDDQDGTIPDDMTEEPETMDEITTQTSSAPPSDISTVSNVNIDQGNPIDEQPTEEARMTLITPPNPNSASSGASNKLVINNGIQLLLSMTIALLFVRYFQTNRMNQGSYRHR